MNRWVWVRRSVLLGLMCGLCQFEAPASNSVQLADHDSLTWLAARIELRRDEIRENIQWLMGIQQRRGNLHLTASQYWLLRSAYEDRVRALGLSVKGYNQMVDEYDRLSGKPTGGAPESYEFFWRLRQPHFTTFVRLTIPTIPPLPECTASNLLTFSTRPCDECFFL